MNAVLNMIQGLKQLLLGSEIKILPFFPSVVPEDNESLLNYR